MVMLDLCILSKASVELVSDIRINQDIIMPSVHGLLVSIPYPQRVNLDNLTSKARELGDHITGPNPKAIMTAKGPASHKVGVR